MWRKQPWQKKPVLLNNILWLCPAFPSSARTLPHPQSAFPGSAPTSPRAPSYTGWSQAWKEGSLIFCNFPEKYLLFLPIRHLWNETATHMETGCVYLKDYVESWEMNRQCPLQAPTFTLPPRLHLAVPPHTFLSCLPAEEVWDRFSDSPAKGREWSAAFPRSFLHSSPNVFPFREFFPLLPLHQNFSLEGMRLTFKYSLGQINVKMKNFSSFSQWHLSCTWRSSVSPGLHQSLEFDKCGPLTF